PLGPLGAGSRGCAEREQDKHAADDCHASPLPRCFADNLGILTAAMASENPQLLAESAVELRRRIGAKEISPVDVLEACIARIERLNPSVNAVTATCYGRARAEAKAAERAVLAGEPLGLLHGLPTGIKDLDDTGGLLTTYGSPIYRDYIPEHDNAM